MKTITDVFSSYRQKLKEVYEANEREAITLLVVSEICGLSKAKVKAFPELIVEDEQAEKLKNILKELTTGKPVQYILGKTAFYGLPFYVNPSVLIPRPETEELVEWVLESLADRHPADGGILDIGTGSGCIAISIKKNLQAFTVLALDISAAALSTAASNAQLNNVNIEFIEADILNLKPGQLTGGENLQVIISNPPYVTPDDKKQMHTNVTGFEPHAALFVTEDDPLLFYRAIADIASKRLSPGGLLFFEINESYGPETTQLLLDRNFVNVELKKDMSGKDRMIRAELK